MRFALIPVQLRYEKFGAKMKSSEPLQKSVERKTNYELHFSKRSCPEVGHFRKNGVYIIDKKYPMRPRFENDEEAVEAFTKYAELVVQRERLVKEQMALA